jgi:hypothetical protein
MEHPHLLPEGKRDVELFLTALLTAQLGSERFREKGRTALTALRPHWDHKLTRIYDDSSARKRHFL